MPQIEHIGNVGDKAGNYRLIRMLGGGGQGEVWLGQNDTMQREGAIKLITYDQVSEDETQRYLDEVKITANLDHENIVKALDSGPFRAGVVYLVLVYAKDGTLREKHAGQCVPLPKVLSYTKQIAAGLQYAHDKQLNHLDIKPSNLLVGPNDQIWISDFGIARIAQSERSLGRMLRNAEGTIGYMSPEQLDGRPTAASDQYSLAVVVYEWICGHRPFSGGNALQVQGQQRTKILSLKAEVPHLQISTEVEQVVLKALNYEPEKRFFTVRDFAHSLELAINDPEHFVLPPLHLSILFFLNRLFFLPRHHRSWNRLHRRLCLHMCPVCRGWLPGHPRLPRFQGRSLRQIQRGGTGLMFCICPSPQNNLKPIRCRQGR